MGRCARAPVKGRGTPGRSALLPTRSAAPARLPAGPASVATNTRRSPCCCMRLRIFRTAPSRLGTSSLCPQMKSFLLRWTPRYGPPSEEPGLTCILVQSSWTGVPSASSVELRYWLLKRSPTARRCLANTMLRRVSQYSFPP